MSSSQQPTGSTPPPVVLAVSAHPDDDTLFSGGALAKWASEGYDVYTLETTRGEGGEVGELGLPDKSELGKYREQEARCAAEALGEKDVFFLDYEDPHMEIDGVAEPINATLEEFSAAIAEYLARLRPEIVVTHGSDGEYGHPQHKFTHVATRAAIQRLAPWRPREFYTWMARPAGELDERSERLANQSDPATLTLDVSPWFERKVAAAMCHRSQHAMFLRNSRQPTVRDMVRRIEHLRLWSEAELLSPVTWSPETSSPPSDW